MAVEHCMVRTAVVNHWATDAPRRRSRQLKMEVARRQVDESLMKPPTSADETFSTYPLGRAWSRIRCFDVVASMTLRYHSALICSMRRCCGRHPDATLCWPSTKFAPASRPNPPVWSGKDGEPRIELCRCVTTALAVDHRQRIMQAATHSDNSNSS